MVSARSSQPPPYDVSSSVYSLKFYSFSTVFNSFPLFFYRIKNSHLQAAETTMFNNSALIISTRTAASPTVVHKKHGKRQSLHFYGDKHYHVCPFFLCTSLPLKGTRIPQGTLRPGWQRQATVGMPSARHRQQASGQPTLSLQAVCTPSLLWQYDERNTFTLIRSPCFSKDSPFLLSLSP